MSEETATAIEGYINHLLDHADAEREEIARIIAIRCEDEDIVAEAFRVHIDTMAQIGRYEAMRFVFQQLRIREEQDARTAVDDLLRDLGLDG